MFRRIALVVSTLLISAQAHAVEEFPPVVAQLVGTDKEPPCTVCHASLSGGTGTVVKPFGQYLRARGLTAGDLDSLRNAFGAARGEKHDTDADGILDIDELKAGTDPNGAINTDVAPITYGCGRISPLTTPPNTPWIVLTTTALLAFLRLRTRRRPDPNVRALAAKNKD